MSVDLIIDNCPLITRALINPWRLASLGVGLVLLIVGSLYLPSEDWDIPICFVMGIPAYILAPWAFRKIWYFQWKWWPLAALAFSVVFCRVEKMEGLFLLAISQPSILASISSQSAA